MICLRCNHYIRADSEMARVQGSDSCDCRCHAKICPACGLPEERPLHRCETSGERAYRIARAHREYGK